jgi:cell division protein FtsB
MPAKARAARIKKLLWLVAAGAAIVFAIQGGEYGTLDLVRQRRRMERLSVAVDTLSRIVDSLTRYKNQVEHDPRVQERIAREEFGMVRGKKELLYRFVDPDSGPPPVRPKR